MGAGAIGEDPRGAATGGQKLQEGFFSRAKRPRREVPHILWRDKRTTPLTPRASFAPGPQDTVMEGWGSRSGSRRESSSRSENAQQRQPVSTVGATKGIHHVGRRGIWTKSLEICGAE